MAHRAASPRLALAALFVGLLGCPGPSDEPDPPYDGPPTPGIELGALVDGVVVPWQDGDVVPWVWGNQGGTMITPVVFIPADLVGDDTEVSVDLVNRPDPDAPESAGELAEFPLWEFPYQQLSAVDGGFRTSELPDQIGWLDPGGVRLLLEAQVTGTSFASEVTVALEVEADAENSCDELPMEGQGCVYRLIEGTGWIGFMEETGETTGCPDPTRIEFEFWPTDSSIAHCAADNWGEVRLPDGRDLPAACLGGAGLELNAEFAVTQKVLVSGTCTPMIWELDLDLTACSALCDQ